MVEDQKTYHPDHQSTIQTTKQSTKQPIFVLHQHPLNQTTHSTNNPLDKHSTRLRNQTQTTHSPPQSINQNSGCLPRHNFPSTRSPPRTRKLKVKAACSVCGCGSPKKSPKQTPSLHRATPPNTGLTSPKQIPGTPVNHTCLQPNLPPTTPVSNNTCPQKHLPPTTHVPSRRTCLQPQTEGAHADRAATAGSSRRAATPNTPRRGAGRRRNRTPTNNAARSPRSSRRGRRWSPWWS